MRIPSTPEGTTAVEILDVVSTRHLDASTSTISASGLDVVLTRHLDFFVLGFEILSMLKVNASKSTATLITDPVQGANPLAFLVCHGRHAQLLLHFADMVMESLFRHAQLPGKMLACTQA